MSDLNAQAQLIAQALAKQAEVAEAAMTAEGLALVERMAQEALKGAQAAAMGAMALRAQELLSGMATTTSADLLALASAATGEIEVQPIEVHPVRIELPEASRRALPQGQRMLNAGSATATPSKAARRRARRAQSEG